MSNRNKNGVVGQGQSLSFDELKSKVTLTQAVCWYKRQNPNKKLYSHKEHDVCFGTNGSVSITDKNGLVEFRDFETGAGGSVIDLVGYQTGLKDIKQQARIVAEDILSQTQQQPTQTQRKKKEQAHAVDLAALYADLMQAIEKPLTAGLNSTECAKMCDIRGFNPDIVRGLKNCGYSTDNIQLKKIYQKHGISNKIYISKDSLVFWDDKQIKAIPLNPSKEYHRTGAFVLIEGAGQCVWMPSDTRNTGERAFVCEGETSAIAMICAGFEAFPRKPEHGYDGLKNIILAYDNDKAGRAFSDAARSVLPDPIDISVLFGEDEDPNDYLMAHGSKKMNENINNHLDAMTKKTADVTKEPLDPRDIDSIRQYFLNKAKQNVTEAERRAMADPIVGEFIRLLDPYRMRKHAPACVLVAWSVIYLSQYEIEAPSNPRIINLVSRSGAGKNWTLGTLRGSRSLYWQLSQDPAIDAYKTEDSSVTGNGLALDAFYWAAEEGNAKKCRVGVWSEFGNAQTRGYGQEERAGSIGNYDVALCDGRIQKPRSKRDLKDLKEYANEYTYNGCEIRAYQNINGAKVVVPRFRGSGEARREFWFYMSTPTDDPAFDDFTSLFVDNALRNSAFMPDDCDKAFQLLKNHALSFGPVSPYYDEEPAQKIKTDSTCESYQTVYKALLETVTNSFYRANKCELLRDKLTFCAGLSAGIHGRLEAIDDDYWIAGYLCECLADSLDSIMDSSSSVDDPNSERSKIIDKLQAVGVKGVRPDHLSNNKKLLAELSGENKTKEGTVYFEDDAVIFWRYEGAKTNKRYFFKSPEILKAVDGDKTGKYRKP